MHRGFLNATFARRHGGAAPGRGAGGWRRRRRCSRRDGEMGVNEQRLEPAPLCPASDHGSRARGPRVPSAGYGVGPAGEGQSGGSPQPEADPALRHVN